MVGELITRDRVLAALQRHIGAGNGTSASNLICEITDGGPDPAAERALREVVTQLRLEGHHICAHPSNGYYMAASSEELDATCRFLFERAMTSLQQVSAMKRISLPDLEGQLRLRT